MNHQFYSNDTLLFLLDDATEYDTATPYRYAVSRFVEVASLIRRGEAVTVISQGERPHQATLQTVDSLRTWVADWFNQPENGGFDRFIP